MLIVTHSVLVPFRFQRVLHESLYGYRQSAIERSSSANQLTTSERISSPTNSPQRTDPILDADLAMALRISEQEQQRIEEELKREEEMLAEVLRLSLEEKWKSITIGVIYYSCGRGQPNCQTTKHGQRFFFFSSSSFRCICASVCTHMESSIIVCDSKPKFNPIHLSFAFHFLHATNTRCTISVIYTNIVFLYHTFTRCFAVS